MSERSIFLAAIDIADPAHRATYLDQACGDDAKLRRHIEDLIAAEAKLGTFLNRPHSDAERTDDFAPVVERPGTQIGPYKLMEQIGEGGFGLVFVAEQQQPVRRKVALKVIKPGMDTREVIARFEAERQALALMDHPHIARVLDAGTTEAGRPYFVMELVRGVPITEYCDANQFTPQQRLELFVDVCHAVQHAHQKGVIHRDLKPNNILVAPHDGVPIVKVIDFGVAKALGQQLTDKTLYTRFAQMIGTPLYMSPEQAEINALDVDTRSDVYSLGVLLYELLTGTTPFDKERLLSAGFDEIRRIIREEEPARPSTRVSTLGASLSVISSHRGTDPQKLGQVLRGDLDVIVMKALEKERGRRYDTPNTLADDIQRYLQNEAIAARPASSAYRLKKFIQRNRAAVAAILAIATVLVLGAGISTWLAVRESQAKDLATTSLAETEQQRKLALTAKDEAERERDKAKAFSAELQAQKEQQRRMLYVAQMNLVRKAWDSNHIDRVRQLLNAVRPQPGEADLRGFEWRYWLRMLHGEERVLQLPIEAKEVRPAANSDLPSTLFTRGRQGVAAATFSPDGQLVATLVGFTVNVWETATGKQLFEKTVDPSFVPPDVGVFSAANVVIGFVNSQRIGILYRRLPSFAEPNAGSSQLRVFNTNTGEEILVRSAEFGGGGNEKFVFSRDGSRFATPLSEPFIQVCSTETGAEIARVAIPSREGVDRTFEYLALSPDGKRLAVKPSIELSSRSSGTAVFGITIFELGTDNRVTTPPVTARQLSFDAEGKYLAALYPGGSDRTPGHITVLNSLTGNELRSLDVNNASEVVGARTPNRELICFSPDTSWLVSTVNAPSGIEALQVWNPKTGEALPKTQGHSTAPVAIGFNADGNQLVSVHNDGKLYFWPLPSQSEMPSSPTETMPMPEGFNAVLTRNRTVTSPDGRWMVSGSGNPMSDLPGAPPTDFAVGALGREFVLKDKTGKVAERVLTLADRTLVRHFSPDSAYFLAAGVDQQGELSQAGQLKIWEVRSGREVISLRMPAVETRMFRGRGFRANPLQGNPRPFRGPTGESALVRSLPNSRAIAFSADSRRVAVALPESSAPDMSPKQIIHAWELPSGRQFLPAAGGTQRSGFACNQLEFSQNGEVLIGKPNPSTFGRNEITIAAALRQEIGSPAQRFAASQSNLQVWSATSGDLLFEEHLVSLAHSSAAGSRIAALTKASDNDNEPVRALVVWDTHMGQELWRMPLVVGRNYLGLVISPDGCRIAIASGDDVVIYNADTGEVLFTLKGHAEDIRAITFNADHSRIASSAGFQRHDPNIPFTNSNEDRETQVWDGATGQELLSLTDVFTGPFARAFVGDAELQFKPDKLLAGAGHEWNASRLPTSIEAQELADWLTSSDSDDRFQTLDELAARLKSDATIGDEARSLALQLVRQRRSPTIHYKQIAVVLSRSDAPREEFERALAMIREANDQTAIDLRHLYLEALAQYRLGDFAAAAATATRAVQDAAAQKCSPLAEDLTILAMAQQQLGQIEAARPTLDRARVLASVDELRWEQLVKEAEKQLAIPPADATPNRWIGHKFMPRIRSRAADETGRTTSGYSLPIMITRVEGNRLWFGKYTIDRSEVISLEDAVVYYGNVFEIDPASVARGYRGIAWRALGEPEKAIEDYSAQIALLRRASAFASRGRVYGYDTGEYEKAIADFDEAILLEPNNALTHENRGEILWRMGRREEALASLNEAIRLDPNCREAYGVRAHVYSAIGETEKMRQDLDEGVRRNPDDPLAWDQRARFLATSPNAEHRDGQQAIVAATKACELTLWNEPPLLDTLAAAHAEVGNFAEAVKWAEKAVALATKSKRAALESRLQLYREGKPYHQMAKVELPSKSPATSNEQE